MKNRSERCFLTAGAAYMISTLTMIAVHLVIGTIPLKWAMQFSVSSYMGFRLWSTVIYLAVSIPVSILLAVGILGLDMPKGFRYAGCAVPVLFAAVVCLPYGLTNIRLIETLHTYVGVGVFLGMMFHTIAGAVILKAQRRRFFPAAACSAVYVLVFVLYFGVPVIFWLCPAGFEYTMIITYLVFLITTSRAGNIQN